MRLAVRRQLARAVALVVVAAGVAVLPSAAVAEVTVPMTRTDVSDANAYEAISAVNGDVTAAGCSSTPGVVGTKTVTPNGGVLGTTSIITGPSYDRPEVYLCDHTKAVGADGTLYGTEATNPNIQGVTAYEPDGSHLWTQQLTVPNCGSAISPVFIRVGGDGNVYIAGTPWFGQCSGKSWLYSYTPLGALRWQAEVGDQGVVFMSAFSANGGGIVLQGGNRVKYFDHLGAQQANVQIPSGAYVKSNNAAGAVATSRGDWSQDPSACGWSNNRYVTVDISTYTQAGLAAQYSPSCTNANTVLVMPNGDAVYQGDGFAGSETKIVRIHYNETTTTTSAHLVTVMPAVDGDRTYGGGVDIIAETNGGLLAYRSYTRENGKYHGSEFRLINVADGSSTMVFYTDMIDDEKSIMVQNEGIVLAPGRLSFVAILCAAWTCSTQDSKELFSLPVAELGMDYPRGSVLGVAADATDVMAVAGDSFTSGVGSLKVNQTYQHIGCARSVNSYGYSLSVDPLVKMGMPADAFVACGGAKTIDMTSNTQVAGQGPQIPRIPPATKAVFLSIGGNDVEFGRLGALCIFIDCSLQQYKDEFNGNLVGFDDVLADVYKAIAAQAPNAHVYVLNYPHILPQTDCSNSGEAGWWFALGSARLLNPAVYENMAVAAGLTAAEGDAAAGAAPTITNDEITWTRQFENSLNVAVSNGVDQANNELGGNRVHLVLTTLPGSPLEGHELCSSEPYFNGLDGAVQANTFHPNFWGQTAMYQLAREALQTHQPEYVLAG